LRGEKLWGEFIRTRYLPKWEAAGTNVVISGHSHLYQRGKRESVIYTIVGGGGGQLEIDRVEDYKMYSVTQFVHHYVTFTNTNCTLIWKVFDLEGKVIDSFDLPCNNNNNHNNNIMPVSENF
jgi:hypothetical protein